MEESAAKVRDDAKRQMKRLHIVPLARQTLEVIDKRREMAQWWADWLDELRGGK
jgi:hypothetical protein